jgi:predicted nuclease of predicted toxin-antitoxin system
VAGRFPVLTDACVNEHFVRAVPERGWDVVRAIDLYPERTKDEVLFERAAAEGRVFVTNDRPAEAIAIRWLIEGRCFRGMVA